MNSEAQQRRITQQLEAVVAQIGVEAVVAQLGVEAVVAQLGKDFLTEGKASEDSCICNSCGAKGKEHDINRYYYLEADLCKSCFDKYAKNPNEKDSKTLRDEFAMAALGAFSGREGHIYPGDITQCYEIADAMLEARKAKGE